MSLWGMFKSWWKGMPTVLAGPQWSGTSFVDSYKRTREPDPNQLLAELKGMVWACASLNAAVCAANPPSLYVTTRHNQPRPKCATRPISKKTLRRLEKAPHLVVHLKSAAAVEEVTDHPLLDLFKQPNQFMGAMDLWELTTLYQESLGHCYWYIDKDGLFGVPQAIWFLPAQNMKPKREDDSPNMVDYFEYRNGRNAQRFSPDEIVHFRYPNPRSPYLEGLSPLRAAFEQAQVLSTHSAFRQAKFENHAVPDAIISPDEVMGEEERDRLESQWNSKFRRGGAGRVLFADSALRVQLLNYSMGDMAALAEMGATKEMITNAFHVPISYWTSNTNLANLLASRMLHAETAINPRIQRRDQTINAQLIPLFDPTGRLFVDSGDASPTDPSIIVSQNEQALKYGIRSINEIRSDDGLPPVPWGETPWVPGMWAPMSQPRIPAARGVGEPEKGEYQDGE
jgi:HK97 family phage portal protein